MTREAFLVALRDGAAQARWALVSTSAARPAVALRCWSGGGACACPLTYLGALRHGTPWRVSAWIEAAAALDLSGADMAAILAASEGSPWRAPYPHMLRQALIDAVGLRVEDDPLHGVEVRRFDTVYR